MNEELKKVYSLLLKQDFLEAKTLLFNYLDSMNEVEDVLVKMGTLLPAQMIDFEYLASIQSRKIEQVKYIKEQTGWGLKESKYLVDVWHDTTRGKEISIFEAKEIGEKLLLDYILQLHQATF